MSRVVNYSSAVTLNPTAYTSTGTIYGGNSGNTSSASTTYATLNSSRNNRYNTTYSFDTSSVPQNATINSVRVYGKAYVNGTGSTYLGSAATLSNGTLKSGYIVINTTTNNGGPFIVTGGTWSRSDISNLQLRLYHPTGGNNRAMRFYGADSVISYNVNGTEYEVTVNNQSSEVTTVPVDSAWTSQGGSQEIKFYGINDLEDISVKDNNRDITSSLVERQSGAESQVNSVQGASYGFAVSGNGYCSTNKGQANSAAVCRLNMTADSQCTLNLYVINYAEGTYDYGIIGKLDTSLTTTTATTEASNWYWAGSASTANTNSEQLVSITIPSGNHYVDIKFRKDTYTDENNDSLWFRYEINGGGSPHYSYTISNISADHTITIEDVGGTFYNVNASSTYTGATVSPSTQSIREGRNATVNIDVDHAYEIVVKDNGSIVQIPEPQDSATHDFIPSSFVQSASSYSNVSNTGNGLTNSGSNTTCIATANTTNGSTSKLVYAFDCSSIPENAVITNVVCNAKAIVNNTGRFSTRVLQLYNGDTAKGNTVTVTTTATAQSIDGGSWTREELNDIAIVFTGVRSSTYTATMTFYGATLLVTYSVPCAYVINNVQSAHTVTVEEAPYYNITTANTYAGATITAPTKVYAGQNETVTISVANIYEVVIKDNGIDVTSSCTGSNGTYRYTITSATTAHSITVEEAPYKTVTTTSNFNGATVSASPTKVYANMSSQITVSVEGLYAVRVKDNGTDITGSFTGSNGTYRYTIPSVSANHTIVVDEAPYHSITVNNNYNAATASTSPTKIYDGMSGVTTIRVSNADEIVVLDDGVNVSSSLVQTATGVYTYTITGVSANHTITINQSNRYTLTASSTYTAVTITPATTEVVEGRNVTFTLEGEEGVVLTTDITLLDNGVDVTNQIVAAEGETGSSTYNLGTFDEDSSEYVGIYNNYAATNAEGNSAAYAATAATASTRSSFYTNSGEGQTIRIVYNIPAGTVPNGAILTNVKCDAVLSMAYTGQGYSTITAQLYAGDVAKGEPTIPTKMVTTATTTINGGSSWTAQELANAKIVISGVRNNTNSDNNTTGQRDNLNIHGATLILEYMYPAGATYTVNNVQSVHTIVVNEVPAAYYDIIAAATYTGATVSPALQSIRNGRNASVNITTDYDYRILVRDNGANVTSQLVGSDTAFTYHITNVQSAHTIVVESAPTYIVSAVSEYTGATISPSSQSVYEGQTATVEIDATNINRITVMDNGIDVTDELIFTEGGPSTALTYALGEFDSVNSEYSGIYNNYVETNAEGNTSTALTNTTRSSFYTSGGEGSEIFVYYTFNVTGLPANAIIQNISCSASVAGSYSGQGFSEMTVQLCAGTTPKGEATPIHRTNASAEVELVDGGNAWTLAEVSQIRILLHGVRNSTFSNNETTGVRDNLNIYGADLIVTYGDGTSFNGYVYTTSEIHEKHDIVITEIQQYTVNASSTVQGITITPTSTTVNEREDVILTINGNFGEAVVLDNGIDVTSQLVTVNETSHTYTVRSIGAEHTVVVTIPSTEHDYIKVDEEFKQVKNYYKKVNGKWTLISKETFSGYVASNVVAYGGKYEVQSIGSVTESSTDYINISINDNALPSGTYTLVYEDANRTPIDGIDKITKFTI